MKIICNSIMLGDGIVVNVKEAKAPKIKDKKLQKFFDKYIELNNKYENLSLQEKLLADNTTGIALFNNFAKLNKLFKNLELSEMLRILLYNQDLMLKEVMKGFADNIDTKDPDYKARKELFIYVLKMYETELVKYGKLIKKAEKDITNMNLYSQKQK